jgi:C-terminal peptidase prc
MRRIIAVSLVLFFLVSFVAREARADNLDFQRAQMKHILEVVAKDVEKNYYDPALRGLEWKAMVAEARTKIEKAQTPSDMVTAIFVLLFKLQDSHTVFLPPGRVNKPIFGFEAKAYGDKIYVSEIKKGSAAAEAGLQLGDQIATVNGFNANRDSFDTMMLYFRALRPVMNMDLQVLRNGHVEHINVIAKMKQGTKLVDLTDDFNIWTLIREAENESEMYHYSLSDDGIGYLQLPSFSVDEESGFLHSLVKKVQKSKAIVIDLRGNPGGTVPALQQFSGFFDPQPTVIAQVTGRKPEPMKIKPQKMQLDGPMFILVDSQTASAAEIFARHFQLTKRAIVIGDHTSGRVTAARFFPEQEGVDSIIPYGVEVTIGHVMFPGDEDLEKRGVTPDQLCIPTPEQLAAKQDPCYFRAKELARKALGIAAPPKEVVLDQKKD